MNIVLHEPEIPANTGNIGRTCVATGSVLHLIKPLGFSLDEKHLLRAGLDYWPKLKLNIYEDYEDFLKKNTGARIYYATTKAFRLYSEVNFERDDYIMFGKESAGRKKLLMCGFGIGLSWGVSNAEIDTEKICPIIETEDYYAEGKFVPGTY